jgi:hypothetical protein
LVGYYSGRQAGFLAGFGQGLEEIVPVNVIQEDILTPVSPTHDGVDRTGVFNARLAGQGRACAASAAQGEQEKKEYMG